MNHFRLLALPLALLLTSPQLGRLCAAESFNSNGTKISYSVQGKGDTVVLIHGWLSSGWMNWDLTGVSALLAKDFQVVAMDVRGHGSSDKPTREEAYGPELVDDVARLLDHIKVSKAHIVGYSMGGIITGKFMAKYPDRVLSGTLGGMGWLKEGSVGQIGFAQIGKDDPNAKAVTICGRSLAKLAMTESELKAIKVPVCVVVGDKDDLIKKLYVEPLQAERKDWPVIEVKGGDHISCILKPQFKEEIQKWLFKQAKK